MEPTVEDSLVNIAFLATSLDTHPLRDTLEADGFAPTNLRVMAEELADLLDYLNEGTAS